MQAVSDEGEVLHYGARMKFRMVPFFLIAGCLHPTPRNGFIICGPGDSCPDDYYCEPVSHSCWHNGEAPVGPDLSAGADDLGGDLSGSGGGDLAGSGAANGAHCNNNGDCASGHCTDGYCCDQQCSGACVACNVAGSEGTCSSVQLGQGPHHGSCGLDPQTSCGHNGLCDGNGACQLWSNTTVCKDSACDSGTNLFTPQSTCDGAGACKTPAAITCAPYLCKDAKTCYGSCTQTSGQCSSPNTCNSMSCGLKALGSNCGAGTECASTYCVDGVCCDGQCNGQCEACKVSGSTGHCAAVNGAPVSPRTPCASDTTNCGGYCDGNNRTACIYPTSSVKGCKNATCSGDNIIQWACNGAGGCSSSTSPCGGGAYTCNASASPPACYKYPCFSSGVCAAGATCCLGGNNFCSFSCPPPP